MAIGNVSGQAISTNELEKDTAVLIDHEQFVVFGKAPLSNGGMVVFLLGPTEDMPLEVGKSALDEPLWELA